MTTVKEQFKSDLRKDPEDLEREADNARADLEGTIDELMQQLSPGELLNQGISLFRDKGDNAFVRNLTSQVENNPIPVVLAGVSLVWLMTASKQPPVHQGAGASGRIGEKAGAARDKLSSATSHLKSSTHNAADRTRETGHQVAAGASDMMHRVSDASRHTADSTRAGLRNAREGYSHMLHEQPLLVGALAVAAGAVLGSLLPRTSAEDRVMGHLSDSGIDAFKERAEEKMQEEQGKASEGSGASSDDSATTSAHRAANVPGTGSSGTVGTGVGQSERQPPQLDPASSAADRESGKTHPGTNY
ncbi:MAG: DUF3618 domain-containing protein [Marinobacter sp.]|uniref:DUF3618 domain-containing protein n=1 Tax=Marinobacter sp. TaxID=50741 RepID=UPI0034A05F5C